MSHRLAIAGGPLRAAALALCLLGAAAAPSADVDLLALGAGTRPVVEPTGYDGWPPLRLLDEAPSTGWASRQNDKGPWVFVFELPLRGTLRGFGFDNASVDGERRDAKRVRVELSDAREGGYVEVLAIALASRADGQSFAIQPARTARFVRLTILDNHGAPDYTELFSFRGLGSFAEQAAPAAVSGTYATNYGEFHLRQQGTSLAGCYMHDEGRLSGSIEGRVMKLVWSENGGPTDRGAASMLMAPDGKSFQGYWWNSLDAKGNPNGTWDGKWTSATVGSCPHWAGGVGGEVVREIEASGRARLAGLQFDTDSATLRPESGTILDDVVRALGAHADWKLMVEGHTDALASDAHNQQLSEARAKAVREALVARGIAAARLRAAGFGESRPVASNDTELGRAQNRRVELVRE